MLVSVPASVSTTIKGVTLMMSEQLINRAQTPETKPSWKLVSLIYSLLC